MSASARRQSCRPKQTLIVALTASVTLAAWSSAIAAPPPHRAILVQNFDLFDTSIDHRSFVIADQKRWLAAAATEMRQTLAADHTLTVIDSPASRAMTEAIAKTYQHPSTCRSCAIAEARTLGARYVFIGSVHKVSDLIIYMRGELDQVGRKRPIMVKSMEVKADDRTMVLRGAAAMARAIETRIGTAR